MGIDLHVSFCRAHPKALCRVFRLPAPNNHMQTLARSSESVPFSQAASPRRDALQHLSSGRLREAEKICRSLLASDPEDAACLHMLGVIAYQTNHLQAAEELIRKALARRPDSPDSHCNLGLVLQAMGRREEAAACYRQALALVPAHVQALNNLGNVLLAMGQGEEAIARFEQALRLKPQDADAHNNLGRALQAVHRTAEAEVSYRRALELNARHAQACFNLGCLLQQTGRLEQAEVFYRKATALPPARAEVHNNLGNVLQALNRTAEALASYRRAIALNPGYAEAHLHMGHVFSAQEKFDQARPCYEKALQLNPRSLEAALHLGNALRMDGRLRAAESLYRQIVAAAPASAEAARHYGDTLRQLGKLEPAEEYCRKAVQLAPDDACALVNLGDVLYDAGHLEPAIDCFERALQLDPASAIAHSNLAVAQLRSGDYARGWSGYEWRQHLRLSRGYKKDLPEPQWNGEPLAGRRILLYSEQGLGDCLQFLRYVPMVQAAGGRVVLEVPHRLRRLAAAFPQLDELLESGAPLPSFDWQCSLLSLPRAFGTQLNTVPAQVPYLQVPQEALQKAQSYSWPASGRRVGLAWAGNPKNPNDRFRSLPLAAMQPLFNDDGLHFYSLQMGEAQAQLAALPAAPVTDLAPFTSDMADTAAFLAQLDLVITVDTSIAHLAGALGRPVWILLAHNADWRWMMEREDSPWYPTARLFRQSTPGDWATVIERVRSALGDQLLALPERRSSSQSFSV